MHDQHIARVKPLCHLHRGDTGLLVSVHNGTLHRCRAAILGQKRAVYVYTAVLGEIQHVLGQDLAVCHDHDEVGGKLLQLVFKSAVLKGLGLINGKALLLGIYLDGRGHQRVAASLGLIGLGDNAHDLLACLHQCLEGEKREVGRAHKQNAHQSSSSSSMRVTFSRYR